MKAQIASFDGAHELQVVADDEEELAALDAVFRAALRGELEVFKRKAERYGEEIIGYCLRLPADHEQEAV